MKRDPVTPSMRLAVLERDRSRYGPEPRPLEQRFWPKVQKSDDCWLWIAGGDGATGYGRIRLAGKGSKHELTHRVAWQLAYGPIPSGMWVLHYCDTPRCVKPEHLFLGTTQDNTADRDAKGRTARGETWYRARPGVIPRINGKRLYKSTAKADPVTASVRWAVMRRDGGCILARFDPLHVCKNRWGDAHAASAIQSLTVEHVKDELMMGRRAPSDIGHLVAMCYAANVGVPSKWQRAELRSYLAVVNAKEQP